MTLNEQTDVLIANMEKSNTYKVLLPTSGTGSRLKDITANTNKALVPLNGRPTISYIIDSYPKEASFVVTLGYLGESVKTYLETAHGDRIFEFVWVDKYEGPGTSLGYSMLKAKANLQCPFIFHPCDNIYVEKIPAPTHNWTGGYVDDPINPEFPIEQYTTQTIKDGKLVRINPRGTPADALHIAIDGIKDYELWWKCLEEIYNADPNNGQISDVHIINAMIDKGTEFEWIRYNTWLDTGNLTAIKRTEDYISKKFK